MRQNLVDQPRERTLVCSWVGAKSLYINQIRSNADRLRIIDGMDPALP